jgi:2-polyprenyl-3-methyl-5-hydroxy-6-metoxy-1,4-benzoquinol methylase
VIDDRPVIAGVRVHWREFCAPPRAEDPDAAGAPAFGLWVPDCGLDALLDGIPPEEFARGDERMPYFGAVWPAAEALAAKLLAGPSLDGIHALDLGCGLGACGFAAACRGARVTFLDWEPRALTIVAASARVQAAPAAAFTFIVGDWRQPPPCGLFDLVLGADVLYEARNGPAVASFLAGHLRPDAEAWLAGPDRPHGRQFPALAAEAGLAVLGREALPAGKADCPITLLRLRRPADAGPAG